MNNEVQHTILDSIKSLLTAMEERQYNTTIVQWLLGLTGISVVFFSAKKIISMATTEVTEVTKKSIEDPELKEKVSKLTTVIAEDVLKHLMSNEELALEVQNYIQTILKDAVFNITEQDDFKEKTIELIESIISSEELIFKSRISALKLINDDLLQQEIGDSVRKSLVRGFVPTYLQSYF